MGRPEVFYTEGPWQFVDLKWAKIILKVCAHKEYVIWVCIDVAWWSWLYLDDWRLIRAAYVNICSIVVIPILGLSQPSYDQGSRSYWRASYLRRMFGNMCTQWIVSGLYPSKIWEKSRICWKLDTATTVRFRLMVTNTVKGRGARIFQSERRALVLICRGTSASMTERYWQDLGEWWRRRGISRKDSRF